MKTFPTLRRAAWLFCSLGVFLASDANGHEPLAFEKDVRPILKQHCFHCHGEDPELPGGLDLRTVKRMLLGGESGPAVVPGNAAESVLWQRVAADEMPEGNTKVPAAQKAILQQWLNDGAKTAREEPDDPNQARFTAEELSHWAFQPVADATPPAATPETSHPIDLFLLEKIRAAGLSGFSAAADRRTLIRRATIDLLGVLPTPEEVNAFLADTSPDAYEKLLDRLLASPHYGERWARHWLDTAGFSETEGTSGNDTKRPHAWRYRDAVIQSFNADKPYDQFVREQLAGDEMAPLPFSAGDAKTVEMLSLSGFLRMAPDPTATSNTVVDRNQAVAEMLKVVSTSLIGLTVGCAQCHDHKYDPISAEDFYRLRAVFDPAFDLAQWKQPGERLVDVTPIEIAAEADRVEAEAKQKTDALEAARNAAAAVVLERELARVPDADREAARQAIGIAENERTAEQTALLKKYPNVRTVKYIRDTLVEYDNASFRKFQEMEAEIAKLRATKPPRHLIMTVAEPTTGEPPPSHVHFRGDPEQPTQAIQPGELTALRQSQSVEIPHDAAELPTTGRRLAYANWLVSGKHPLTARVFVNRVWLHHFGQGIVGTPGDFGMKGERPTHPELLDWLARDFVAHGWRIKRLHKLMMTSAAYRQSSRRTPAQDAVDADNRMLARMNLRRLEAEAVRDAVLCASGRLSQGLGGPSIPVVQNAEGSAVLGNLTAADVPREFAETAANGNRRSVYVENRRVFPLALLETFDMPVMSPNCDLRRCSTVAPQSLLFLNDEFIVSQSAAMAERLMAAATDSKARIKLAFELLYAAEPNEQEESRCVAFLLEQAEHFRTSGDAAWQEKLKKEPQAADLRALSALCQTLLCSNRFLYVD